MGARKSKLTDEEVREKRRAKEEKTWEEGFCKILVVGNSGSGFSFLLFCFVLVREQQLISLFLLLILLFFSLLLQKEKLVY